MTSRALRGRVDRNPDTASASGSCLRRALRGRVDRNNKQ